MTMRISTAYFQQRGLDSILDAQARVSQLQSNIASAELTLDDELLAAIGEIHQANPNPAP